MEHLNAGALPNHCRFRVSVGELELTGSVMSPPAVPQQVPQELQAQVMEFEAIRQAAWDDFLTADSPKSSEMASDHDVTIEQFVPSQAFLCRYKLAALVVHFGGQPTDKLCLLRCKETSRSSS